MSVDHWMMFGTFAEQRYFVYPSVNSYRGVFINANMAAYAPDGMAAFLIERTASLPYMIDPQTHAFQHEPSAIKNNEGKMKNSIKNLCEIYGEPIKSIAGEKRLLPNYFKDAAILSEFVNRCIDFQRSCLSKTMANAAANKYLGHTEDELRPYAVVAPYFYMTEATIDKWLPLMVQAANLAVDYKTDNKVFVQIVINQGILLNSDAIRKICDEFKRVNVDGFLLWIDDLNEHTAGTTELRSLLMLSRNLRLNNSREVINLHGGYFSILAAGNLGDSAMSGVAHGPEFGEHRPVVPVGGGIPIARYYIPALHARVKFRNALTYFRSMHWLDSADLFYENVCNCRECRETIKTEASNFTLFGESNVVDVQRKQGIVRMEYPTSQAKEHCLRHYLERKSIEYADAKNKTATQLLADLKGGREKYEGVLGAEGVSHLILWENVLTKN